MGRKKKFEGGSQVVSINVPILLLECIDKNAKGINQSRSEYMTHILRCFGSNNTEFCRLMAKMAASDMYYWQHRIEQVEINKEIDGK